MALSTLIRNGIFRQTNLPIILAAKQISRILISSSSIQHSRSIQCSCVRYVWTPHFRKGEKVREKDQVPPQFEMIYNNPQSKSTNYFHLGAVIAAFLYGIALFGKPADSSSVERFWGPDTQVQRVTCHVIFTLFVIGVINVSMKMPMRIYNNGEQYILLHNGLFGSIHGAKKLHFNVGQCKKAPDTYSLFNVVRYKVKDKVIIIFEEHFKTSYDMKKMVGESDRTE